MLIFIQYPSILSVLFSNVTMNLKTNESEGTDPQDFLPPPGVV